MEAIETGIHGALPPFNPLLPKKCNQPKNEQKAVTICFDNKMTISICIGVLSPVTFKDHDVSDYTLEHVQLTKEIRSKHQLLMCCKK